MDDVVEGPISAIDAILGDYNLPHGAAAGALFERRNALARHIGTVCRRCHPPVLEKARFVVCLGSLPPTLRLLCAVCL